jgi:hypothetical protein
MAFQFSRWGSLAGGLFLVALGVVLIIDDGALLPPVVQRYWPLVLIVWGVWKWFVRYRVREDRWAGPDYGTGLYVIRSRRRQPRGWLPGLILIGLGGFFVWVNFNLNSGVLFGPLVLIALGVFQVWRSFRPPPRTDF